MEVVAGYIAGVATVHGAGSSTEAIPDRFAPTTFSGCSFDLVRRGGSAP
jgi:hypothetical protein